MKVEPADPGVEESPGRQASTQPPLEQPQNPGATEQAQMETAENSSLKEALAWLKPAVYDLGLRPSRIMPFIPDPEEMEENKLDMSRDYLKKSIKELVIKYEIKNKEEEAAMLLVDKLLADNAPPSVIPLFMDTLVAANNCPQAENPNEGAWRVHDVLQLASTYMPLQNALVTVLAARSSPVSSCLQTLIPCLQQQGLLSEQHATRMLTSSAGESLGRVAQHLLTYIYLSVRLEFVPRLATAGRWECAGEAAPSWLERLSECMGQAMEVREEEKNIPLTFRERLPAVLVSPDTWRAVSEKLLVTRQYRTRNVNDGTQSEAGADSTITSLTAETENPEDHRANLSDDHSDLAGLQLLDTDGENLEITKQRCTEQYVDSHEVINHCSRQTWQPSMQPRETPAAASSSSLETMDSNASTSGAPASCVSNEDNTQAPPPDGSQDPRVRNLARTFQSSGLAESPDGQPKTIVLKDFQDEALAWARERKNVAIFLPTGAGKTYLVLKYVQEFLSRSDGASVHVAFLAPKVKLAEQQYLRFLNYFPDTTYLRTGKSRSCNAPFSELRNSYQVFVMTPRCLVEAVDRKELQVTDFNLLVLDECHHTMGKHDFKVLMDLYMDTKFASDGTSMPQVIGLTASPGAGRGDSVETAVTHITQLCHNLDVERIGRVEKNITELEQFISKPSHEIHKCSPRKKDKFKQIIEGMMKTIEDGLIQCSYIDRNPDRSLKEDLVKAFKAPDLTRGQLRYTQWIKGLQKRLVTLVDDNREAYLQLFSLLEMLERYQKSLALNEDCESRYALEFLQSEIKEMRDAELTEQDSSLLRHFDDHAMELEIACRDGEDFNPKLRMLEDILLTLKEKKKDECACMVFVRTIDLSIAIERWIQDHPDLKSLNPGRVTGCYRERGMTQSEVSDVLDKFNKGDHKIVICTSVAEEGLDIKACSVVIRYDHQTSMIAMIQSRGRARHWNSQYFVLGDQKPDTKDRERGHLAAERLMNKAIAQVQQQMDNNSNNFLHNMTQKQMTAWKIRKDTGEKLTRKRRLQDDCMATYKLICRKCQAFACMATDIRLLGASNRLVIAEDFQDRCKKVEKKGKVGERFQHNLEKRGKMHCKECSYDWGCVIQYLPTGAEYPLLKFKSFFFEDTATGKKLKGDGEPPFAIETITDEELENGSAPV